VNVGRRTGILGGTFDPIHVGHLAVAAAACRELKLDEVILIPSHLPPHRPHAPIASGYHRFAMVALALVQEDAYRASDLELSTGGPSYTSVTLDALNQQGGHPSQIFFITGADAFAEIASWRDYPDVLDRSHFVVVSRPGHRASDLPRLLPDIAFRMRSPDTTLNDTAPPNGTFVWLVDATTPNISSSDIRRHLAGGHSVEGLVPQSVAAYLDRHQLYRSHGVDTALHD
jgi:nicotinate-nucleotide adenylyltransferase